MATIKKRAREVVKGMAFFGVLGPLMGAFIFSIIAAIEALVIERANIFDVFSFLEMLPLMAVISYIVAGIPAVATGLVAGLVRNRLQHLGHCILIGIVGCLISMLIPLWIFFSYFSPKDSMLFFGPVGFIISTVCAMFFRVKTQPLP